MDWRWVEQLTRLFELCQVTSAETAVILGDAQTSEQLRESCHLALQRLTPEVISVLLPDTGPNQQDADVLSIPAVQAAVQAADFVADCTRSGLAAGQLLPAVLAQNTRVLALDNSFPSTLFDPHVEVKTRVQTGLALLAEADSVVLQTPAGQLGASQAATGQPGTPPPDASPPGTPPPDATRNQQAELAIPLATAGTHGTWGFCNDPGSWACWPSGMVGVAVGDHDLSGKSMRGTGRITLSPGDLNLAARSYLRSSVTLALQDGAVVEVVGSGDDVSLISAQFEALLAHDPQGSGLQTLGWGMQLPAKLPHFPTQQAANSLLDPLDFPADPQVMHLAGVCFVAFGSPEQNLTAAAAAAPLTAAPPTAMPISTVRFALRCANVILRTGTTEIDLIGAGELKGSLAPDVYEIASRG